MINLEYRTVHVMAKLVYPTSQFADMIELQTDRLLPERQLPIALVGV